MYCWAGILLVGFCAAIAIPAEILLPAVEISPTLAFTVLKLITIGLPLAALFAIFYCVLRMCSQENSRALIVLLLAPFAVYTMICVALVYSKFGGANAEFLMYDIAQYLGTFLPLVFLSLAFYKKAVSSESL